MARETSISDMFSLSGPRISALGLVLGFVSLGGASSCLYHASDRCDSDQTYNDAAGLCVCDESLNLIAGDHGCVPCDANATAKDDACTCNDGYSGDGMTCTAVPKALGLACTSDADCTDATYNTCHIVTDGSSYCTNTACTTVDDATCTGGYACDLSAKPSYCERPPSGAQRRAGTGPSVGRSTARLGPVLGSVSGAAK